MKKVPPELDRIIDKVLAYRLKKKTKKKTNKAKAIGHRNKNEVIPNE